MRTVQRFLQASSLYSRTLQTELHLENRGSAASQSRLEYLQHN